MSLLIPLALIVFSIPLLLALFRANELFCLTHEDGRLRVRRGRIPPRLLGDIADVLRNEPVGTITLRGVVEDRIARIYADGELSDAQKQQLRNTLAQWPVVKIRNAPRRKGFF